MLSLGQLRLSIFVKVLTISAWAVGARAGAPPTKIQFEQKTGLIVWKMDSVRKTLEPDDETSDPDKKCEMIPSSTATFAGPLMAQHQQDVEGLKVRVRILESRLGVRGLPIKMNAVRAEIGDPQAPLFVLFPEFHLNKLTYDLHTARAMDMFRFAKRLDEKGLKAVNLWEGARGTWKPYFQLHPESRADREAQALELNRKFKLNGSQLIGEVYGDVFPTEYHDDNDLSFKNVLAYSLYLNSLAKVTEENNWEESIRYAKASYPRRTSAVQFEDYRGFYDEMLKLSPAERLQKPSDICEARSAEMVNFSAEFARAHDAGIVLMSFGTDHTHGVVERIRQMEASYIIYSPNF